jgi:hypothetical protein
MRRCVSNDLRVSRPSAYRLYFEGRALPKRLGVEGLGASLDCLGFFFSFRLSLFPIVAYYFGDGGGAC